MESRERVQTAFRHKTPDRVPVDFGGHRSSGISVQAYKNLRNYLGLGTGELYVYDVVQQLAVIEDDVLEILETDVIQLGCEFYKKPDYWKEWRLHDGTEVKIPKHINIVENAAGDYIVKTPRGAQGCIQKKGCLYFEQTAFPYYESSEQDFCRLEEDLQEIMWMNMPCPPAPYSVQQQGEAAKALRKQTTKAIYGIFGGGLIEPGEQAFRMDQFLLNLACEPQRIDTFLEKLLELNIKKLEVYLEEVGPYIDIIGFSDDLGMQDSSQISPGMFKEMFQPRYREMWQMVKRRCPHLKICLHSCGSIYTLLDGLIEAGMDSFNPVQITCANMEPEKLKSEFGERLTFWGGGCDTRWVLPCGSKEDVERNVAENIEVFAKNGGFIFQQVHNILADVPPENIVAMFEAVRKYG